MTDQTNGTLSCKINNNQLTDLSSLENITGELLLYTARKTGLMIPELKSILQQAITLAVDIASMGHACRTPVGLLSIVLLPEDTEFSEVGIGSRLFPGERLLSTLYSEYANEWGYEHMSSGKMNRALRKTLAIAKRASKIKQANETSLFGFHYSQSYRKHGE